jgi:hypothetical protein
MNDHDFGTSKLGSPPLLHDQSTLLPLLLKKPLLLHFDDA